jgi:cation transport protein ChaC
MSAGDAPGFWVFAYGSLMWDPGFAAAECRPALLRGRHRAFCVYSYCHRGTVARPGLVLGLAPGGTCRGIAYRVAPDHVAEVKAYLFEREMRRYEVYREAMVPVALADRRRVVAQSYVADCRHRDYAGALSDAARAALIRRAVGERGPNLVYLERTMKQLAELGIREPALERLAAMVAGRE